MTDEANELHRLYQLWNEAKSGSIAAVRLSSNWRRFVLRNPHAMIEIVCNTAMDYRERISLLNSVFSGMTKAQNESIAPFVPHLINVYPVNWDNPYHGDYVAHYLKWLRDVHNY